MRKLIIPPVFVLLSIALIIIFFFLIPDFRIIPFPYNLFGVLIAFWGFTIMGRARELFKKHSTTLDIERSSYLITDGVFSRTRNPMYIGMFLLLFGVSVCTGNFLSMLSPFLFLLFIRLVFVPKEERLMTETFGDVYLKYKKEVRRWI